MFSVGLILLLALAIFQPIYCDYVITPHIYAEEVIQQMVKNLNDAPNSVELMKLDDFSIPINKSKFGTEAIGDIQFHSGFVLSFDAAGTDNRTFTDVVSDKKRIISAHYEFYGMQVVYDAKFKLKNYDAVGTFVIKYPAIEYKITITRWHVDKRVEGTVKFQKTNQIGDTLLLELDPDNRYTQIIASEIKKNYILREPIDKSFEKWEVALQPALNKAIADVKFPPLVYYN